MNTPYKILLVEDEINLGQTLSEYLSGLGHDLSWAQTATQARELFNTHRPQILLLDIGLPDGNGIDLAREFRKANKETILLFLSALNDPETRLEGLEIGADDYITKPFALKELVLRLNRILKSANIRNELPEEIIHGKLKIWLKKFEVQDGQGAILNLSQKECEILELLYTNAGQAVDREKIIEEVWGENKYPSNRTVDNYIVKLRKWCETDSDRPIQIESIRSVGYKLIINK